MNLVLEPVADSFQLSDFQVFKIIFSAKYPKKVAFFVEKIVVVP